MRRRRRQVSAPDFAEQLQPEFEHEQAAENSPEATDPDFEVIDQLPAVIGPENGSDGARRSENGSELLPVPYRAGGGGWPLSHVCRKPTTRPTSWPP